MYKRLRRNFILVTMLAVILVISIMIVSINIFNYQEVKNYGDRLTIMVIDDRSFFDQPASEAIPPMDEEERAFFDRPERNKETAFETRFFVVRFNGDEVNVDNSRIAFVSSDEALLYAKKALDSGKERGTIDNYRFLVKDNNGAVSVAFVDCTKQIYTASNFLKISILVSALSILVVFVLVYFVSGKVVAPISKSYERQKQFITDASHELKTPLTIISANNELVEMEYGANSSTEAITKQVGRMNTLVKNMSLLSKIEEDARFEKKDFSLSDALVDTIDGFMASLNNKEVETDIDNDININADENLIRQVLAILLDNARKYSLSKINISLKKTNKVYLTIKNDSENIDDIDFNKVFERFYRSSASRASSASGSGIGLAIAKEIVKLHNCEISASGEDNNFIIKVIL